MIDRDSTRIDRRGLLRASGMCALVALPGCLGLGGESAPLDESGETHTLTVRLEEADGDPAHEVSVSVSSDEEVVSPAQAKVPNENGVVTFDLAGGDYTVQTESQEYANESESVTIEEGDEEVTITLERGIR